MEGYSPVVKATEWFHPLMASVTGLPARSWGAWQSLHAAPCRWLERVHSAS